MDVTDSVVELFHLVADDSDEVAQELWQRCEGVMRVRARHWVRRLRTQGFDAEDLVASAFCLVWQRRRAGAFSDVDSAGRLRALLFKVIDFKVSRRMRAQACEKRGCGQERREESAFANCDSSAAGLDRHYQRGRLPESTLVTADMLAFLLENADADLRRIVLLRLQGKSLEEIAEVVRCCVSTVMRKLRRVEQSWARMLCHD